MGRRLAAEGLGALLLSATVIGSGIMAERLAGGNIAIALLANTGATVAVLAVLIALFAPISGAHFNPAVSLVQAFRKEMLWREAAAYALFQILGCCLGALLAHVMFELPLWQFSLHARTGFAQWLAEAVATFGLILVVLGHRRQEDAHARSLSDTFAGIRPDDAPGFIAAQLLGATGHPPFFLGKQYPFSP
jgi:glycerol uptake facilitator-like aquaporin